MTDCVYNPQTCTGCGACAARCPQRAIRMEIGEEGFVRPVIDADKCVGCGLCARICPAEHPVCENAEKPECLAAAAADELRRDSSSGAVFPLLAERVLQEGGTVFGAARDEDGTVRHIGVDDLDGLRKLKSSKYVQSETGNCYRQAEELLKAGREVLFSGTPCQIAGLNAFLGRKYDNLLTVDVVCHGVPSPLAFRRYAEELTEEGKEKVLAVNFRDKVRGWYPYFLTVKTEENVYSSDCRENEFMRAFLANLCLRKSCAACPFARFPRQGDLTLGDFWGIGRHAPDLDDNLGTSLVLINTERGRRRMAELTPRLKFRRSLPLARAIEGNPSLVRPPVPHPQRDYFFARLEQLPFKQNVSHCFNNRYDCGILNFWFGSNYGAMLTCYALQESVKRLGLKPKVINYVPANVNFAGSLAETFAGKYLDLTELCTNAEELRRLNRETKAFIVGSDQVWRHKYSRLFGRDLFWLSFAAPNAKKIAYAASFGRDRWEADFESTLAAKYYISRFDRVSVREDDGVGICRDVFGVEASHVLDPVFLADPAGWDALIENSGRDENGCIVSYVLDSFPDAEKLAERVRLETGAGKVVNLVNAARNSTDVSPEDWLCYIKNCRFLVTDSFHGVCFAIIFNRPFICLANTARGYSHFRSLFKLFGLEKRCVTDCSRIGKELFEDIDYARVNRVIADERERSLKWLEQALLAPSPARPEERQRLLETAEMLNEKLERSERERKRDQKLLYESVYLPKIRRRYFRYKLKSVFSWGKKRKKYKRMKKALKEEIRTIGKMLDGGLV